MSTGVASLASLPTSRLSKGSLGIQPRKKMEIRQNKFWRKLSMWWVWESGVRVHLLTSGIVRRASKKTLRP